MVTILDRNKAAAWDFLVTEVPTLMKLPVSEREHIKFLYGKSDPGEWPPELQAHITEKARRELRKKQILTGTRLEIDGRGAPLDPETLLPLCPNCGIPLTSERHKLKHVPATLDDYKPHWKKGNGPITCQGCHFTFNVKFDLRVDQV